MVYRRSLLLLAMIFLVTHADGQVQEEWVGIVEPADSSACMAETHWIADPCNFETGNLESSTLDLDESVCRYVRLEGPVENFGGWCDIMDVQSLEIVVPICRNEVLQLRVRRPPSDPTVIEWWVMPINFPCLESYDVIRGTLPVGSVGSTVDLGSVTCIEDDILGPPAVDDAAGPPSGQAFFYLVRFNGAPDFQTYGVSSSNAERMPLSGDCVRSH
jgi:hypothetical protein